MGKASLQGEIQCSGLRPLPWISPCSSPSPADFVQKIGVVVVCNRLRCADFVSGIGVVVVCGRRRRWCHRRHHHRHHHEKVLQHTIAGDLSFIIFCLQWLILILVHLYRSFREAFLAPGEPILLLCLPRLSSPFPSTSSLVFGISFNNPGILEPLDIFS